MPISARWLSNRVFFVPVVKHPANCKIHLSHCWWFLISCFETPISKSAPLILSIWIVPSLARLGLIFVLCLYTSSANRSVWLLLRCTSTRFISCLWVARLPLSGFHSRLNHFSAMSTFRNFRTDGCQSRVASTSSPSRHLALTDLVLLPRSVSALLTCGSLVLLQRFSSFVYRRSVLCYLWRMPDSLQL